MSSSRSCHYLSTLLDKFSRGPVKITSAPRTRRNKSGVIWRWSEQASGTPSLSTHETREGACPVSWPNLPRIFFTSHEVGRRGGRKGEEGKKGKKGNHSSRVRVTFSRSDRISRLASKDLDARVTACNKELQQRICTNGGR